MAASDSIAGLREVRADVAPRFGRFQGARALAGLARRRARRQDAGKETQMQNTDPLWDIVDGRRAAYAALADRVFETPEVAYTEHRSAAAHAEQLAAEGARVATGLAGIPTAMTGEWGEGGPVIAILGEYDALPGLGQEPGVAEERPVGRFGHGCGHNLLGSAAMMAAASLAAWLAATGRPGRVRYYGCPAEEGGAAKTFMVREGLFADVDAAITWHPGDYTGVVGGGFLANTRIDFTFSGKRPMRRPRPSWAGRRSMRSS
jgi:aminobenzoyl-glutamate utilization protein B